MSQEQLLKNIEEIRQKLDGSITGREDLAKCQELSEELDRLLEEYHKL